MNDKASNNQLDSGVYSLRQRYLFVSAIIVFLIFAFAWLAQSYVSRSSEQNQQSMELRHQASLYIRQLRNEVLQIEKGLEAYMWTPTAERREAVHSSINSALHSFDLLRLHQWLLEHNMERELGDFALDLKALHITLNRVMDIRLNGAPESPVRQEASSLGQHVAQHFTDASDKLRHTSPDIDTQLDAAQLRWNTLQDDFTASLTTTPKAASSEDDATRQQRIERLHSELREILNTITRYPRIASNAQRLQQVANMQESLNLWQISYDGIKGQQGYSNWRSEIPYLKHTVEPHFEHLWLYITKLDTSIDSFSISDSVSLSHVANTVAKVVWLLSFFGLAVISVAYLYFQSTVLRPIANVAAALKSEAAGEHIETLPQVLNLETRHLVNAFDEMRQQVQDRQQALEHIAMHDSLTALPNRYHLMGNLQALCETSQQQQSIFAVIMLGLDRFKDINDTLGQQTGDDILKQFGRRLRTGLRENDHVARFASDEFAILLPHANYDEALHVAHKIRQNMERPLNVDGISLAVSCSIGIALYPDNGQDKEELTRRANIAMAIAKQHKTGVSLYDERHDTSSVERISLAGELRQAIRREEFFLCYQPQYAVHNQQLSGLEVLCRWNHSTRGTIKPDEFIPVAEYTGEIHAITEWVVTSALQQATEWRRKGLNCGVLSINISAFNLHAPNFEAMLKKALQRWDYPAAKLILEITETAMMADPEHAIKTLGKLHQLGLKLSIDDYGTGFSSLAYVKQLPVDELKIDKSFVMDMTSNENDAVIVRSTIDLAHNLGLRVVAEGVDTQEKQDLLEILNCDYMQGYHLGKPMSVQDVEAHLPPRKEHDGKVHHLRDFR